MTTATTEGRRLRLDVDGIDEPILIDPISAKRGRYLTRRYLSASLNSLTIEQVEGIWIEALGPQNYSNLFGVFVERVSDDDGDDGWRARPAAEGEIEPEGLPIRQEEGETLCMAAFLWNSILGMEGVNAYLSEEGTAGILKINALLTLRLGLSPTPTSRSGALENLIQSQASTPSIPTTTAPSSTTERLPAKRRSVGQNSTAKKAKKNRR